jgi:hypothetical protein
MFGMGGNVLRTLCAGFYFLLAATLSADVVTLKSGSPLMGTVVSVNSKSVTLKTARDTRVLPRSDVVRIDFGTNLVTGIDGDVYTNASYGLKMKAPTGWNFSMQPGLDVTATNGIGVLFVKALPSEGSELEEGMIKGAIGGMLANVPDAHADTSEEITWGGRKCKKVDVHASSLEMTIIFVKLPTHFLMVGFGVPPDQAVRLPGILPQWEKGFQIIAG